MTEICLERSTCATRFELKLRGSAIVTLNPVKSLFYLNRPTRTNCIQYPARSEYNTTRSDNLPEMKRISASP